MESVKCPVCGRVAASGEQFCLRDGTPLGRPKKSSDSAAPPTTPPPLERRPEIADGDPFANQRTITVVAPDGRAIRLECGDRLRVGRSPDSPLANVCGDNISWNHAELYVDDDAAFVLDTHSTNGTYIDGTRLSAGAPFLLEQNATVHLGTDPPLQLRIEIVTDQ